MESEQGRLESEFKEKYYDKKDVSKMERTLFAEYL
jgi:hypothetical protein